MFVTILVVNPSAHWEMRLPVQLPVASSFSVKNLNITFNMGIVWLDLIAGNMRLCLLRGRVVDGREKVCPLPGRSEQTRSVN
jgi:hypothetical protein